MEKNEFMFGNISSDKLIEAQGVIMDVMHFVEKNKDSDDPEARKAAKTAMCILAIDDMMRRPVMNMLAESMVEQINSEKENRGGQLVILLPQEVSLSLFQRVINRK